MIAAAEDVTELVLQLSPLDVEAVDLRQRLRRERQAREYSTSIVNEVIKLTAGAKRVSRSAWDGTQLHESSCML